MNFRQRSAESKARKIGNRMQKLCLAHSMVRFWTFTFYEHLGYFSRMKKWAAFMKAIRYYYPNLGYTGAKELHPGGNGLHLHLLFDTYVSWQDVQAIWEKVGAGKVIRVEIVPARQIARYITKYITKTISDGDFCRPYLSSRKFCLYLGNFLRWVEKLAGLGDLDLLKFILEKVDQKEYSLMSGSKKRKQMSTLWNIAISLGL